MSPTTSLNWGRRLGVALAAAALLAACTTPGPDPQGGAGAQASAAGQGAQGAPAAGTIAEFVQVVTDRVFFTVNSSSLSVEARQTLNLQAQWLLLYQNYAITIEGHADERGTREYNLALGDRRANAVRNYLMALGIDQERILTISSGEERPADPGHDESAWAQNRRAVTTVATTG
jgi:peptidoglycan-associated lipoprotein